ncbi:hypothetical protein GCM10011366_16810 [Ornithinimicrobium tianjinense]|uniref:Uncharacterized protein n=1 Tax=Ornithinimicrobium tianjinense TaxID=1195761 RepID=A0A917BKK9_9MICO|nr:hypothetical protein GCM10011366_16810 [Ornithinimicrobium tianjinense]
MRSGGVAAGWGTVAGRARGDTLGLDLVRYVVGWAVLLVSHGGGPGQVCSDMSGAAPSIRTNARRVPSPWSRISVYPSDS